MIGSARMAACVVSMILLAACGDDDRPRGSGDAGMGGGTDAGTPGGDAGEPRDAGPHDAGDVSADVYEVEFETSVGNFVVQVHRAWAPNGADRFRELVTAGFYDECRFFRVVPGFVAQFGMNGDPATNAMWSSRTIPDDPVVESNVRGYVTFAQTSARDSRTTQLFINYGNNAALDTMRFAPFAMVTSGMDVVDMINSEYGEMPSQSRIASEGNTYLMSSFPRLDYIIRATVR